MNEDKTNVWFRMGVTGKFTASEIARMCDDDFKPVTDCLNRGDMSFDGDCYSPDMDSDDSCIGVGFNMKTTPIERNLGIPDLPEVVEVCPYCENEVVMSWDVKKNGFKAFCPYCGKTLMPCDECKHRGYDGEYYDDCDYCSKTDTCRFNK